MSTAGAQPPAVSASGTDRNEVRVHGADKTMPVVRQRTPRYQGRRASRDLRLRAYRCPAGRG